jgi:hypothetical protein
METMTDCALDITQYLLDQIHMNNSRSMHEGANLLNNIANVWSCKCEVLEGTSKALILHRIF